MYPCTQGVVNRKLALCPKMQQLETDDLIETCECCELFLLHYCQCPFEDPEYRKCASHEVKLVFTDGACINNGGSNPTSGIGVACSSTEYGQLSKPITLEVDSEARRTNQRAEMLAAIEGIELRVEIALAQGELETFKDGGKHRLRGSTALVVVATDSEYVVKGMTEWLPNWKNNKMRTGQNKKPTNLDLFIRLDKLITAYESDYDVKIGFWHILREYNQIADDLAKSAAPHGELASAAPPVITRIAAHGDGNDGSRSY